MTFSEINRVSRRLPQPLKPEANMVLAMEKVQQWLDTVPFTTKSVRRFVHAYSDVSFGWYAANRLAEWQADFPVFPSRRMKWVYMAWRLLQDYDKRSEQETFGPIMDAIMISSSVAGAPIRQVLQALLIIPDLSIADLAKAVNYPAESIEAYEALFFNVQDRRDEHMFIRNIVYPNSRYEEMAEGYADRGNIGKMLQRLAYNKGLETTLHYAGFRVTGATTLTHAQAFELFQQELMSTGYLMATSGFLQHRHAHPTLSAARQLAQATKIAGQDTGGLDEGIGDHLNLRAILDAGSGMVNREVQRQAQASLSAP